MFVVDLNSFFKLSSARREDYASLEEITDLPPHYSIKHTSRRWETMKNVVVRSLEQLDNLLEYFLNFLPKQGNFKGKNSINQSQRYQRIKEFLDDKFAQAYLAFIAFAAQEFEKFLLEFQCDEPFIHILYPAMVDLLSSLLSKFIRRQFLYNSDRDVQSLKTTTKLISLNVSDNSKQRSTNLIDIDTKTKFLLNGNVVPDDEKTVFRKNCLKFYVVSVSYLQTDLPLDVNLIKHAQFIHPEKQTHPGATSGMSNLSLKVSRVLKNVLPQVFSVDQQTTVESICDEVRKEWQVYQCESVPQEFYVEDKVTPPIQNQDSYWRVANESAGLEPQSKQRYYKRIDHYWCKIGSLKDDAGNPKYPHLFSLVR